MINLFQKLSILFQFTHIHIAGELNRGVFEQMCRNKPISFERHQLCTLHTSSFISSCDDNIGFYYLFSNTFERIHTNSEAIWNFHLYTVYEEYIDRIAPPFNLLVVLPTFLFRCKHWMSSCRCKGANLNLTINQRFFNKLPVI